MRRCRTVYFAVAILTIAIAANAGRVHATPLERHDCYSKDVMRRIEGCSELLKLPHLAPSVRAQALALRALALSLVGRYDEAVSDYDQALAIQPDHAVTLNNRAWALYKMGRINGEWLAYDIVVEKISLVRNYRTTYAEIFRKDGVDGLLAQMEAKLEQIQKTKEGN